MDVHRYALVDPDFNFRMHCRNQMNNNHLSHTRNDDDDYDEIE